MSYGVGLRLLQMVTKYASFGVHCRSIAMLMFKLQVNVQVLEMVAWIADSLRLVSYSCVCCI